MNIDNILDKVSELNPLEEVQDFSGNEPIIITKEDGLYLWTPEQRNQTLANVIRMTVQEIDKAEKEGRVITLRGVLLNLAQNIEMFGREQNPPKEKEDKNGSYTQ